MPGGRMKLVAEPLTEKAFAPYGDVLAAPPEFGRAYFDEGLRTSRATAWPSLSVSLVRPLPRLPLEAKVMERHERSEEHTSELQSLTNLVCRLLLEKKKTRHCAIAMH